MVLASKIVTKLSNLIGRTHHLFKCLNLEEQEAAFVRHNKRIWRDFVPNKANGEILVESYRIAAGTIAFSYLANVLAKIHNARIKVYAPKPKKFNTKVVLWNRHRRYKSFNAVPLYYELTQSQTLEVERLFKEIYPALRTKQDVEDLRVEGLWIGDLLYDSYLMGFKVPTVRIEDENFQRALRDALGYYVYWRDYFDSHNVKSVIVSHCVYSRNAIILRLAIQRRIPAYQANAFSIFYLTEQHLWAYDDFFYYREEFKSLPPEDQKKGLELAKERIDRRLAGEVGVDMFYSTKSAFAKATDQRVLAQSPRIKILIAPHCFFETIHAYGVGLFTDFYEWLTFLGDISERTDYDWYIKTHPDIPAGNNEILEDIICKYPKFTWLPKETSHLQVVKDGIDFVLTVHGTLGFEYAALGMPVINASMCNPHVAYNFNIHPRTVEEYNEILLDLANQKLDIDINEVYEFYYMYHIENRGGEGKEARGGDWLVKDFIEKIGGYTKQNEPTSYQVFLDEFSERKHEKTLRTVKNFIESKNYYLKRKHCSG